jgi:type II secretory pathway pseudopilin PulG
MNMYRYKKIINKYSSGMTLLEIVIYVALFSICMTSVMMTASAIQKTAMNIKNISNISSFDAYIYEFTRYHILKQGYFSKTLVDVHIGDEADQENILNYLKNEVDIEGFAEKISKYLFVNYNDFEIFLENSEYHYTVRISYTAYIRDIKKKRNIYFNMI